MCLIIETVYVYDGEDNGGDPAQVLIQSLSKLLVQHYPLAGRIVENKENGKMEIHCNQEGALFAEAYADHDIKELKEWTNFVADQTSFVGEPYWKGLVLDCSSFPGARLGGLVHAPILSAQVTKFKSGGFTLGIACNHLIMDGISFGQVLNSWANLSRGIAIQSTETVSYHRSFLKPRSPPCVQFPHLESLTLKDISNLEELFHKHDFIHGRFPFTSSQLDLLKNIAMRGEKLLHKCTGFEAIAAHVWRVRTKALGLKPAQTVKFMVPINGRPQILGRNTSFVGNLMVYSPALSRADDLIQNPLAYAVRLIQEAKRSVTKEYIESAIDHFEISAARPTTNDLTNFNLTNWSWIGLNEGSDFGWGAPLYAGPSKYSPTHRKGRARLVMTTRPNDQPEQVDHRVHHLLLGLPSPTMETFKQFIYGFNQDDCLTRQDGQFS